MKRWERFRTWLIRKTLNATTNIDYGLKQGDMVEDREGDIYEIVALNWALRAFAIRRVTFNGRPSNTGTILVYPVWSVKRVS